METTRQCPQCGLDLSKSTVTTCPRCGTVYAEGGFANKTAASGARIWWAALFQIAICSVFMVVFRFPKVMIAIFSAMILIGTGLSAWLRFRPARPASQLTVARPVLFRILTLAVALCSIAGFGFLLFGGVMFANSWSDWQRYNGQPYHRADFTVTGVYYQKAVGRSLDLFATGTVEGAQERMSLPRSLYVSAYSQGELEERVPIGTTIPIYFFPKMQGRLRVRVYDKVPTAEAYHRDAMNALEYGLGGLAICGGIVFVLLRLRAACFARSETQFAATV